MDVQVSLEAGAGCDHSKLRNYFSNAAISKNQPIENRKLGRAEYTQDTKVKWFPLVGTDFSY
jgi:hypothetical protein